MAYESKNLSIRTTLAILLLFGVAFPLFSVAWLAEPYDVIRSE